jgi:hypothetical protein
VTLIYKTASIRTYGVYVRHQLVESSFSNCPPITASFRDGKIWTSDGQHRTLCALESKYTHIYAMICVGLTYAEESDVFYIQNNNRRNCNGWTKFKAAWGAKSPVHEQLMLLVEKFKLTTPINSSVSKVYDADFPAPIYLLHPYAKGGLALVSMVCQVYSECFRNNGTIKREAKHTALVRGLSRFLKEFYFCENPLPWDTIKMVLKNVQVDEIHALAKKQKATRTDQKQYHQALCILFGKDKTIIKSPSCHLNRAA